MDATDMIIAYCKENDIECRVVQSGGGDYIIEIEDKMYLIKPY